MIRLVYLNLHYSGQSVRDVDQRIRLFDRFSGGLNDTLNHLTRDFFVFEPKARRLFALIRHVLEFDILT